MSLTEIAEVGEWRLWEDETGHRHVTSPDGEIYQTTLLDLVAKLAAVAADRRYTQRRQLLGKESDLDALWACITAADAVVATLTERCEGAEISMIDRGEVIERIESLARQNATVARAHALHREERAWLDVLAIIERSPS